MQFLKKFQAAGSIIVALIIGSIFYMISYNNKEPSVSLDTASVQANTLSVEKENEQNNPTKTISMNELKIETISQGTGEGAKNGDMVTVHYTGTLTSGKKFDSSRDSGNPFSFQLGAGFVIKGWDQGLLGMKVGEVRKLSIPSALAYGPNDVGGGLIPANSDLIFDVEMIKIN